jgi:Holliday junction resolvasome RuvABC DNA-binding subunit
MDAYRALGTTNYSDEEKHDIITLALAGYTKQEIEEAISTIILGPIKDECSYTQGS